MDDDPLLEQLNELFDNKLDPVRKELRAINNRLDLVAAQVAKVGDNVAEVKEIVSGHTQDLDKLQRRMTQGLDRLDDHAKRIDAVEAKTAHLPTPPHS
jgi:predicted  nucleic acid-binding Zn-ribbon protein